MEDRVCPIHWFSLGEWGSLRFLFDGTLPKEQLYWKAPIKVSGEFSNPLVEHVFFELVPLVFVPGMKAHILVTFFARLPQHAVYKLQGPFSGQPRCPCQSSPRRNIASFGGGERKPTQEGPYFAHARVACTGFRPDPRAPMLCTSSGFSGPRVRQDNPLVLAAAKSILGHTEGSAGVAGLIKMVAEFNHRPCESPVSFPPCPPHTHTHTHTPTYLPGKTKTDQEFGVCLGCGVFLGVGDRRRFMTNGLKQTGDFRRLPLGVYLSLLSVSAHRVWA